MKKIQLAIIICCFILTACSGEPSSTEIEKIVKSQADQGNQLVKKMLGESVPESMLTKVHEVKKISCEQVQTSAVFNCTVEIDAFSPLVGRNKNTMQLRLVKGENGWRVNK